MKATHSTRNKNILISSLLILFLLIAVAIKTNDAKLNTVSNASVLSDCEVPSEALKISTEEKLLYEKINDYRKNNGLNPLKWSNDLIRAATWMSNDMLVNNYLSHTDSSGRNLFKRISNCSLSAYDSVGENIDSGTSDPLAIFQTWEHSPAQKANILSSEFEEIGISFTTNASKTSSYWAVNYGSKLITPTYPPTLIITKVPTPTISYKATPTPIVKKGTPTPTTGTNKISPTNKLLATPSMRIPTRYLSPTPNPTSAYSYTPTPTLDPTFVANPYDLQLAVQIKIIGIGTNGNKNIKHLTRHVVVGIYDLNNTLVAKGTGFATFNKVDLFTGIIHFGPVLDGVYYVKVYSDYDLQTVVEPTFQTLSSAKLNVLPKVTLIQGDINSDNAIDMTDYNLTLICYQTKDCVYQKAVDFNDDGVSNVLDYNLLLHNYWSAQGD